MFNVRGVPLKKTRMIKVQFSPMKHIFFEILASLRNIRYIYMYVHKINYHTNVYNVWKLEGGVDKKMKNLCKKIRITLHLIRNNTIIWWLSEKPTVVSWKKGHQWQEGTGTGAQTWIRALTHLTSPCCLLSNIYMCNELRVIWPIPHEVLSVITRLTIIT